MIKIDDARAIIYKDGEEIGLGTPEGFEILSNLWLRSGWDTKYVYSFAWLGRPIIQLPEDMIRIQELIFELKPDLIIETGVAHGGSLIFYASLCKAMDKGRVVGIDIEIRPHNRKAIEGHFLSSFITLIEGGSTAAETVTEIEKLVKGCETVMVILDSNHSYNHVKTELELYGAMVTKNSFIVATDGIMAFLKGAPRSQFDWDTNNPKNAAEDFVNENRQFEIVEPNFPFNEGDIQKRVSYWPSAYIKKLV